MPRYVDLKSKSYDNAKSVINNAENLDIIVDDVVYDLVTKSPKLVNDAEKGLIPYETLQQEVTNYIDEKNITLHSEDSREKLNKKVKDYLFGYGILQELIDDMDVSDIRVIGTKDIRKKVLGKRMSEYGLKFASERSLLAYCYYLSIKNGGSLSEISSIQVLDDTISSKDFILRINITINPVSTCGPTIHIRKMPKIKYTFSNLINYKMMNKEIAKYMEEAAEKGLSIIFCGKGGAGKSTLMNTCLDYIPHNKSGKIMQEAQELFSDHPEIFPEKMIKRSGDSDMEISLLKLTVNGLLQDLDYIIVGETKGAEAMELINAIYTGHIGWTSVHAKSAREALNKIVHYMKYSGTDLKRTELLQMLASIDVIVYMKDFKICEIVEVEGFNEEKEDLEYNHVYQYTKDDGFTSVKKSCDKVINKLKDYDGGDVA